MTQESARRVDTPALTNHQLQAAQEVKNLLQQGNSSVTLGGLAGTGKTTVVSRLHEVLGLSIDQIAYCAFTGKAAAVVNRKFPQAAATTIHSLIYRAIENHCKTCPARFRQKQAEEGQGGKFCHAIETGCTECRITYVPKERIPEGKRLIVVDEASMVPEGLALVLQGYGLPIVWVGDHGQLPPVRSSIYLMEHPDVVLKHIHRQVANSPILRLAMHVRKTGVVPRAGKYGPGVQIRRGTKFVAHPEEWAQGTLAAICPTNDLRVAINKAARRKLGFPEGTPVVGDRVICLRNNPSAGIFNGIMGTILALDPTWFGQECYDLEVQLDHESRIYQGRALSEEFNRRGDRTEFPQRGVDLWEYGYALTCHKAQGSEYPRVVVVANVGRRMDRRRWLYTAVTRASEELEILIPE